MPNASWIGFVNNWILRGDTNAAEGIYDLLEATEVNHDGVVNTDPIELAEKFAECGGRAIWKRVAVRLRGAVIGVDLVVIGCTVKGLCACWDRNIDGVPWDAEHAY